MLRDSRGRYLIRMEKGRWKFLCTTVYAKGEGTFVLLISFADVLRKLPLHATKSRQRELPKGRQV